MFQRHLQMRPKFKMVLVFGSMPKFVCVQSQLQLISQWPHCYYYGCDPRVHVNCMSARQAAFDGFSSRVAVEWLGKIKSCLTGGSVSHTRRTASVILKQRTACRVVWRSAVNKAMWEYTESQTDVRKEGVQQMDRTSHWKQQNGVSERPNERQNQLRVYRCGTQKRLLKMDQRELRMFVCHTSVLGCDVCFAGTSCPTFNTLQPFQLPQILPKRKGSICSL